MENSIKVFLSSSLLLLFIYFFQNVHMAHALRRISYATCDPEHSLFSFLARQPKGHFSLQYCHSFITRTPEQVKTKPYVYVIVKFNFNSFKIV